jgi:hypothetical protein
MNATSGRHDAEIHSALELSKEIEATVPAEYRVPLFTALTGADLSRAAAAGDRQRREAAAESQSAATLVGIDLGAYAKALEGPGRLLTKALITLEIVVTQMGVDWMTPAEIERFLVERARARHVYRTNVSNALRRARGLVDRRRRGRAYEYRITEAGLGVVEREITMLGPQSG